jgi:phage shock protein A
MGIFTRFRDIVSSNINSMLDRAEDPEKLIRLMIREMEDTLVELKAACAGVMAETKTVQRRMDEAGDRSRFWADKAKLAIDKGRDELAREALVEKRRHHERFAALETELKQQSGLVAQYHEDIRQLEDKLKAARDKQRLLVQRHIHADRKRRAQEEIRRVETSDALFRYEELENRIDRMEADAELVNYGRRSALEEELNRLGSDEDIERELQALKSARRPGEAR